MVGIACGVLKNSETVRDMDGAEVELAEGTMVYQYDENTTVAPESLTMDSDDPLGITPSNSMLLVEIDGNMQVIYPQCSALEFLYFKTTPVKLEVAISTRDMCAYMVNTVQMNTIYNARFKYVLMDKLFKYIFADEYSSDEFDLLLNGKHLQFFITSDGIKTISVDGKSHYLTTPMPIDVCMTFFCLYEPCTMKTTVHKLQLRKDITPDELNKYSKLIDGWKVGDRPLTLQMLNQGFSARIDIGGLFDIIVDGHIVTYGFDHAFMLYEDWYSVLVVDDEINTIKTTSEFVLHVKYGEKNWASMLDDIIDETAIEQVVENKVKQGCATGYTCVELNVETKVVKPEHTHVRYTAVYKKCLASCVSEM